MAYYMVSYDLRKGESYDNIIAELKRMGAVKYQESAWLVEQRLTTGDILSALKSYLPDAKKDKLMVARFSERPRFTLAFTPAVNGIKAHFPT